MRLAFAFLAVCVVALPAQTRSRKAHEHGSAKVNIAFETVSGSPKGVLEFEAPAESVVGFEHTATSKADKASVDTAMRTLIARFGEMVILPPAAACKLTNQSATVNSPHRAAKQEQHAEVNAVFGVACAKPLAGTEIRFGFARVFPKIHSVDVALLAGEQQLSVVVENDKGVLKIAR